METKLNFEVLITFAVYKVNKLNQLNRPGLNIKKQLLELLFGFYLTCACSLISLFSKLKNNLFISFSKGKE